MKNRAVRRQQELNRKQYVKHLMKNVWQRHEPLDDIEFNERNIGILANTPHYCHNGCCRNPRHNKYYKGNDKLTIQERKNNLT